MLYLYYVSCVALSECVPASVWCPVVLEHFVCGMFWVQHALGYHITNSQSRYITPAHLKSAQYSLHNNAPSSRKLLKMDVLTSETCWAVNWHNKASVIKLVYLYSNFCSYFQLSSLTALQRIHNDLMKVNSHLQYSCSPQHLSFKSFISQNTKTQYVGLQNLA